MEHSAPLVLCFWRKVIVPALIPRVVGFVYLCFYHGLLTPHVGSEQRAGFHVDLISCELLEVKPLWRKVDVINSGEEEAIVCGQEIPARKNHRTYVATSSNRSSMRLLGTCMKVVLGPNELVQSFPCVQNKANRWVLRCTNSSRDHIEFQVLCYCTYMVERFARFSWFWFQVFSLVLGNRHIMQANDVTTETRSCARVPSP